MTLPRGWVEEPIGAMSELVTSGSRGWAKYYADDGPAFIRIQNIKKGNIKIDLGDIQHVRPPNGSEGERTKLLDRDILITITADLGRIGLFTKKLDAYVNQHIALVRLTNRSSADYVAKYLTSEGGQTQLGLRNRGITRSGLGLTDIGSVSVPLPPPAEQRRIVAKLDALSARIARARAELDRVPKIASLYRKAVLSFMTQQSSGQSAVLSLGELLETIRTGPFGSSVHKSDYIVGGVPLINPMHIVNGHIIPSFEISVSMEKALALSEFKLSLGEVIIGRRGEMGRCAVVQAEQEGFLIGTGSMALKPRPMLKPEYLQVFLMSPQIVAALGNAAVGSTMVNLNQKILLNLPISVPHVDEQARRIKAVRAAFARADRLEAEAARARKLLDRLESAILAKAFRGELVPQDENDEPAEKLLERIRAQREAAPKRKRGRSAAS